MEGLIFALACYKKLNSSIVDIFIEEKAVILVIVSKGTSFDQFSMNISLEKVVVLFSWLMAISRLFW